jgi:hypothetical protein
MILDGLTIAGMVMVIGILGVLVYFCNRDGCLRPR